MILIHNHLKHPCLSSTSTNSTPGSCDLPIAYSVKRHGNLARVIVHQNGKTIGTCTIRVNLRFTNFFSHEGLDKKLQN